MTPETRECAVAFANNIMLFEVRETDMALTLDRAVRFFRSKGMTINPKKYVNISAAGHASRSVSRSRAIFKKDDTNIRTCPDIPAFWYLGLEFCGIGAARPTVHNLSRWLTNLLKAPLKPNQKFILLKDHLIPRIYHGLQTTTISSNVLVESERLIRNYVRKALHLAYRESDNPRQNP